MFFLCSYKYERYSPVSNSTLSISPCLLDSNNSLPIPVVEKSQSKINNGKMIIFYLNKKVLFKVFIGDLAYGIWFLLSKALLLKLRYYSAIKKIIEYKAEAPILWPPDVKSQLIGKDPDAKEKLRAGERGATEDEVVGWHHQLNGHEFEQTLGDSEGQGRLVCCNS